MNWIETTETDGTKILLNVDRISIAKEDGENTVLWMDNGMRVRLSEPFYSIRNDIKRGEEKRVTE